MFDNPTDNHTDIEVPLYYKLRFTKLKSNLQAFPGTVEGLPRVEDRLRFWNTVNTMVAEVLMME